MRSRTSLVVTSISPPNPVLTALSEGCADNDYDFILIGDIASPDDFFLDGCDFWGISRQKRLGSKLAALIPEKHYARKNLGYLIAMERGTNIIIETDDDNIPYGAFWQERSLRKDTAVNEQGEWINVYRYFSDENIWPRGFPFQFIKKPLPSIESLSRQIVDCPIQQGLADCDPDVDAVYRLILPLPQTFAKDTSVALGRGSWSPFNSQNTTWFKEAFPLLYLPSYCSFRMTDIWRSFIAQRICWANNWHVLFHSPSVYQERNEHNLDRDFIDEIPGYLHNAEICSVLAGLNLPEGAKNIPDNMRRCYHVLESMKLVDAKELTLLDAWLSDTEKLSQ